MMKIFIKLSELLYPDKFDYKDVKYVSNDHKINIKCITCESYFDILPNDHFTQRTGGCIECSKKCKDDADFEEIRNVNIEEYKNRYLISSKGRCFSKVTGIEFKQKKSEYQMVGLTANKIAKLHSIHILVYRSFNDDYTDELVVDHIDGVKKNNDVKNLRLCTQSENVKNAYKNNINMHKDRPISAYDKGGFVKSFKNTDEARNYIGHKDANNIRACLRGQHKTAGKLIWNDSDDKMIEINKAKFVDDTEDYVSLGKIDGYDFSNYYINKEGIIVNTKFENRKIATVIRSGYISVQLWCNNEQKNYQLYRLIAKVYLENGEFYFNNDKYVVNHKNKKKLDNRISNLEWTTKKENSIHGRGKKVAKIDKETDVILETYITITEANEALNKTGGSISNVCNGKGKTAYGFKWKFIVET